MRRCRSTLVRSLIQSTTGVLTISSVLALVSRAALAADAPPPPAAAAEGGTPPLTEAPAPAAEPPAPPAAPPAVPSFVEHLGASAYPGELRGIYGGSMWLEPSFNGLQWPYMDHSGVGVSGYGWVDTGRQKITRGLPSSADTDQWVQQARGALRITPTYVSGQTFIQTQLELVANKDQVRSQSNANSGIVDVDDLWLRFGRWSAWDVKVGRFEGWEVYHTGMGLDINTLERRGATQQPYGTNFERPDYYGLTFMHDRPSDQGTGDVAIHLYPTNFLRFELLAQIGANVISDVGNNTYGARPVVIFDYGFIKVKAGLEYLRATPAQSLIDSSGSMQVKRDSNEIHKRIGYAGEVQLVFNPRVELGFGGGYATTSDKTDTGSEQQPSTTIKTFGGFANVAITNDFLAGAGLTYTNRYDDARNADSGKVDFTDNLQWFVAAQYLVSRQLYVKAVVAYASSLFDLADPATPRFTDSMISGRVRLMYLF